MLYYLQLKKLWLMDTCLQTSYLFAGFEGSEMYGFGYFGTKIQKAIELRPNTGIKIFTEEV